MRKQKEDEERFALMQKMKEVKMREQFERE